MANLFALCRNENHVEVKRVSIIQGVQAKIEGVFQGQAAEFLDGISEEVEFGSDWKPDEDELLVIDAPAEAAIINNALNGNLMALPVINAGSFIAEGIKALFVAVDSGGAKRVLIQSFTAQQILARRFSLFLDGDTFKELTAPAFTFDNYLAAIIEGDKLKFKSYFKVKRIFELAQFYQEASDQEIEEFCAHESLSVGSIENFKEQADQGIRKLTHAIHKANVLDQCEVSDIAQKANALGLNIEIDGDRIVMPADRKAIKHLLRFLDDGIYEASLTAKRYVTNSKRPL